MIPLPFRTYALIGAGLACVLLLAWGLRVDYLRGKHLADLLGYRSAVSVALSDATGAPVKWQEAPAQITALGDSVRDLKASVTRQNKAIDDMAREAVRLKAEAAELRRIAEKAKAQRAAALAKLSDMAITPGTRADCEMLLAEANAALDLVREAGL